MEISSVLMSMDNCTTVSLFIDGFHPVELINYEPVTIVKHDKNVPIGYWDYSLIILTESQRIILTIVVIILLAYAVFGNCATIYVNIFRKRRPFFRVCLLSLAISDLLISIFQSASYISQFSDAQTAVWRLGEVMCGLIPFVTTAGILVNSMTLVGIALDRYMAVKKVIKGTWEPGSVFCATCVVLVWGLGAGIASPMMTSYFVFDVYVILSDPDNHSIAINVTTSEMCVGEKSENGYYFGIVFGIVFIPLLVAFSWLNMTIAKEIYNRRHPVVNSSQISSPNNNSNQTTTDETSLDKRTNETDTTDDDKTNKIRKVKSVSKTSKQIGGTRKIRQLRMFIVIIVIITLFLLLRLPTWIFLLLKMHLTFSENYHWMLNYSFGILSLTSCVVNPFLYTFLSETLIYGARLKQAFKNCGSFLFCGGMCCAAVGTKSSDQPVVQEDIRHIKRTTPVGCVESPSPSERVEQNKKFSRIVEIVNDIDDPCDADGGIYKGFDNNVK